MADRKTYIGGNWKMNLHRQEAVALAGELAKAKLPAAVEVAICPAFVHLDAVANVVKDTPIRLGAQDFYIQANGAYTGEVSLSMLQDLGVSVVLVGHSERRHVIGESETLINDKVLAALDAKMQVILCIGETLAQRESGKTDAINCGQLGYGLAGVTNDQMANVVIAYEPVWAIGTGRTATPDDAQSAHAAIRSFIRFGLFNDQVADALRIQYGGSMKPGNAGELLAQPDIDGGLIGSAALKADDFMGIINAGK